MKFLKNKKLFKKVSFGINPESISKHAKKPRRSFDYFDVIDNITLFKF